MAKRLTVKEKNEELKKEGKQLLSYAFKLKIKPTEKQKEQINKTIGCSRFIFNQYLSDRNEHYKLTKKTLKVNEYKKNVLVPQKQMNEYLFLKEVDKFSLEIALENVENSFKRFFKKQCKFPKFKSKRNNKQSYSTSFTNNNISVSVSNKTIKLPKLKEVSFTVPNFSKTSNKKDLLDKIEKGIVKINKATISKSGLNYFVSLNLEEVVSLIKPLELKDIDYSKVIGLDLGLLDFAIINNGAETNKIDNPRYFRKAEKKLAKLNRRLSKKREGSNNFLKAKDKLNKHHTFIKNQREDFLHKLSRKLINENQVIIVETLNIKGMVKNKKLSKSINDAGWHKFISFLSYKTQWEGKHLIQVDRYFASSKICSTCGNKNVMLSLNEREWTCSNCNSTHNRDANASINIREEGIRLLKQALI